MFCLHTIQSNTDSLLQKAYQEQMNGSNDKSIWLQFVKSLLYDLGFSHIWNNQYIFNASALLSSVKTS